MSPLARNRILIVPCVVCGRSGVGHAGRGMCRGCYSADRRKNPEVRERDRAHSRAWKAANHEANRERDRAYRAAKRLGDVVRLTAVPDDLVFCRECGEQMLEWCPEGICGFCIEEAEAA